MPLLDRVRTVRCTVRCQDLLPGFAPAVFILECPIPNNVSDHLDRQFYFERPTPAHAIRFVGISDKICVVVDFLCFPSFDSKIAFDLAHFCSNLKLVCDNRRIGTRSEELAGNERARLFCKFDGLGLLSRSLPILVLRWLDGTSLFLWRRRCLGRELVTSTEQKWTRRDTQEEPCTISESAISVFLETAHRCFRHRVNRPNAFGSPAGACFLRASPVKPLVRLLFWKPFCGVLIKTFSGILRHLKNSPSSFKIFSLSEILLRDILPVRTLNYCIGHLIPIWNHVVKIVL